MNRGKAILLSVVTLAWLIMTGLIFGFSQMGDCNPDPSVFRACLEAQRATGNEILMVAVALYACAVALITCWGKKL